MKGNEKDSIKPLFRQRVYRLIKERISCPALVIAAPSGTGKTTAVKDFLLRQKRIASRWITLKSVPSPESLRKNLDTLQNIFADLELNNTEQPGNLVIVVEGCSGETAGLVFQLLDSRLERQPAGLHWVLLCGTLPSGFVEEWEMKGLCGRIAGEELAFNQRETAELCRLNGVEPLPLLCTLTEGWAAPLAFLIRTYLQAGKWDSASAAFWLENMLLSRYARHELDKLHSLAPLGDFEEDQAYVLTGCADTVSLLAKLRRDMLLKRIGDGSAGDSREDYGYQDGRDTYQLPLFLRAVFLAGRERRDICSAFLLSGEWALARGRLEQPVAFFLTAGSVGRALELLASPGWPASSRPAPALLAEFFTGTQPGREYPIAWLRIIGWLAGYVGYEELLPFLARMKAVWETRAGESMGLPTADAGSILTEIRLLEGVLCCRSGEGRALRTGFPRHSLVLPVCRPDAALLRRRSYYYADPGALLDMSRGGLSARAGTQGGSCYALLAQAEMLLETGRYDAARKAAYKALLTPPGEEDLLLCVGIYLVLGRVAVLLGEWAEMERSLEALGLLLERQSDEGVQKSGRMAREYLYGLINLPGSMLSCREAFREKKGIGAAAGFVVRGMYQMRIRDYARLPETADGLDCIYKEDAILPARVCAYIYRAVAACSQDGAQAGVGFLKKALALSKSGGLVAFYEENAADLLPILEQAGCENDYEEELLRRMNRYNSVYTQNCFQRTCAALSGRESEIMDCMADGYKRNETAQRLYLSVNTVKTHQRAAYRKLGARSRAEAIRLYAQYKQAEKYGEAN